MSSDIVKAVLDLMNHPLADMFLKRTDPKLVSVATVSQMLKLSGNELDGELILDLHGIITDLASSHKNMQALVSDPAFIAKVRLRLQQYQDGISPSSATAQKPETEVLMCRHCGLPNVFELDLEEGAAQEVIQPAA